MLFWQEYAPSIKRFLDNNGVIVWGIVPTGFEAFEKENMNSLTAQLENVWQILSQKGIDIDHLIDRSMLSPATCCLVNPDKEKTVEKAFSIVQKLSSLLRTKYDLN